MRAMRLGVLACLFALPALAGPTLDAVRRNGLVRCGVSGQVAGMSLPDSQGRMQGFDAEMCRAVAAAVFGDAEKVRFVPTTTSTRFPALQSGEIDMLSRTTALTITRDSALGLTVVAHTFFTGQGVLINKRLGITSAKQLDGATICAVQASEVERNVMDYARANNIRIGTVAFDTPETVVSSFLAGRCDAISNDMINLSAARLRAPNPDDFVLLPDLMAKEPQGMLVRNGDPEWAQLVRWSFFALLQAEEYGLTKANVEAARRDSQDPKIRRFLGLVEDVGQGFGLPASFAYEIIRQVGNYGEVYEKHVGAGGLGMPRGANRLWTDGGLHVSWLWQ